MRSRAGSADGSRQEVYRSPWGIAHSLGGEDNSSFNSKNWPVNGGARITRLHSQAL